jgi:predicted metalloprotease with PDZ domain
MEVWRLAVAAGLLLEIVSASQGFAQETVSYLVRVDDPGSQLIHVEADLATKGDTTYVSLPAWTPGHYELENYARYIRHFEATGESDVAIRWDKVDADTWRIVSEGTARVTIAFDFLADTLNLSGSLLKDDFGFFNGTNLFVYPEGDYEFSARVRFDLPEGWRVATELEDGTEPGVYLAGDYHELVDNPTFLGHFAIDSVTVDDRWIRLAVYPAGYSNMSRTPAREMALEALAQMAEVLHGLFGEPPYDRYTTFVYLEESQLTFAGGLEHSDSHLDIIPAIAFQNPRLTFRQFFYRLLAHEYYHAWNVKRIRPAEMWPYAYDEQQYTPLLWVSEGITDYYAHIVLTRAGLWGENEFILATRDWIVQTEALPARVAVEDASIDTWIDPRYINRHMYYDAGAILGLMLDIKIRDATDNQSSLDDVMARLYNEHYLRDLGFTTDDFLAYVGEHIGLEVAEKFYRDYVDGREPYPYREVLTLAGLTFETDTLVDPFFGVQVASTSGGRMVVRQVVPGSAAAAAGLQMNDFLLRVGVVEVMSTDWGDEFAQLYGDSVGDSIAVVYQRGGHEFSSVTTVRTRTTYRHRLFPAQDATETQLALRRSILTGTSTPR